jgi:hypothetical protein
VRNDRTATQVLLTINLDGRRYQPWLLSDVGILADCYAAAEQLDLFLFAYST